jgi:hypothetical protein
VVLATVADAVEVACTAAERTVLAPAKGKK